MNLPLFPFMNQTAALKYARHLVEVGVHLATRASSPARFLVYVDRTQAHAEYLDPMSTKASLHHNGELGDDDPKRFKVWGRGYSVGFCSAKQLDAWREGKGNTALSCSSLDTDNWLANAVNGRHVTQRSSAQELLERKALTCGCGLAYTWSEYLEKLQAPIKCRTQGVSDQVEGEDENFHPVILFLRDCSCGNTMGRAKPEGA